MKRGGKEVRKGEEERKVEREEERKTEHREPGHKSLVRPSRVQKQKKTLT